VNIRSALKPLVAVAAVLVVSAPGRARAESYFNPWAGVYFGSGGTSVSLNDKGLASFGGSFGDTGSKIGGEIQVGYSPDFFGPDSNVVDVMGGFTAGPQIGRSEYSAKPYVAVGVGLLRSSIGSGDANNNFGFNVGGGVLIYFSTHLGIRGEARYFRVVNGSSLGDFYFTRAQFGLLIR
jgi:opacity protein-like surface antigen